MFKSSISLIHLSFLFVFYLVQSGAGNSIVKLSLRGEGAKTRGRGEASCFTSKSLKEFKQERKSISGRVLLSLEFRLSLLFVFEGSGSDQE